MLYLSFSVIHQEKVVIQRGICLDILSIHISYLLEELKLLVFMKGLSW